MEYTTESASILYVGDGGTRSIIVWNVQTNDGYRVKLPHTKIHVENPLDDVFYTALIEHRDCKYIYFTYLSSRDLFRTKTKDLQKHMDPKSIVNIGKRRLP